MKRVLITGASGFLGSHLVDAALEKGWEVYAGLRASSSRRYLKDERIRFFEVDFSKKEALRENLKAFNESSGGFHYVIQNAGVTRPKKIEEFYQGNAVFTAFLAKQAMQTQADLQCFMFISSLAALGPTALEKGPITEGTPANPITPYGRSKLAGEQKIKEMDDCPYLILRPTGVYGPRDKNFGQLVDMQKKGWDVRLAPDRQQLSFIQVQDLAIAAVELIASGVTKAEFNITDGRHYSPDQFSSAIQAALNIKPRKLRIPRPLLFGISYLLWGLAKIKGDNFHLSPYKIKELTAESWSCDISALKKVIDYSPQYDLQSGMADYLDWLQKENSPRS